MLIYTESEAMHLIPKVEGCVEILYICCTNNEPLTLADFGKTRKQKKLNHQIL